MTSSWIGPVLGAIIIVVGFIGYQQWHEAEVHKQQCRVLMSAFTTNTNGIAGLVIDVNKSGSTASLGSPGAIATAAYGNGLMNTMDIQCSGWRTGRYN